MNQEIADDWIQASGHAPSVAARDLLDSFQAFASKPDPSEKDRVVWILKSCEMRDWIQCPISALLMIELPPTPGVFSVTTYASAILIRSIMGVGTCPILYQFLELRASDPDERNVAGDTGMMVSLITQLLPHALQEPSTSLDFVANEPFEKTSRDPLRLFLIFKRLLRSLPMDRCVYIVLDAVSALRKGENGEENGVVAKVLDLVSEENLFVKILISGPSSATVVDSMISQVEAESRISRLYVPEHVGSDYQGSKTAWVEKHAEELIRGV